MALTTATTGVTIVLDGALVDPEQATISILDRGLLFGDGCFEVLRTWNGRAVDLDAHLDRLIETARYLRLRDVDLVELEDAVETALQAAGPGDHRIRVVLTRGPGALAVRMAEAGPGRSIVIVEPLLPQPEEMSLALVDYPIALREGRGHKTLSYLDHVIARELARDRGADEALRLDATGGVAEGGTCNVFVVRGGAVFTPDVDAGVLPGVVRARVLTICERLGLPARVGRIPLDWLAVAEEVFATSSLRGVVPVTRIDVRTLPAGPATARIAAAYVEEMSSSDI